ncbi:MAG TPA: thioesterase family protein [Mycobacteriales bacterium]
MSRHTYLCPLRWADMDPFGHVNNTLFVAYLEQARVDLLFHRASQEGIRTISEGTVVARHEIDYLRPVRYQHRPLRIDIWCSRIAGASFTMDYEIFDGTDGTTGSKTGAREWLAARARSLLVPYDLAAGRPRRLTPGEREFLGGYLEGQPG